MLAREMTKAVGAVIGPGRQQRIETRSTHQGSECAAAAANCSRAAKQVQLLEGEENICLVDSQGKDEKKIHGRTLAGHRAGVVAHSRRPTGASSEVGCRIRSGGEELPSGIAIIVKLCLLPRPKDGTPMSPDAQIIFADIPVTHSPTLAVLRAAVESPNIVSRYKTYTRHTN